MKAASGLDVTNKGKLGPVTDLFKVFSDCGAGSRIAGMAHVIEYFLNQHGVVVVKLLHQVFRINEQHRASEHT